MDKLFIRKAQENAKKHNVILNLTEYDWREIEKHFPEKSFDAVLCLGNSLTQLFDKKDQLKAIKNFLNVLTDDGILIIDERNYQSILDRKEKVLKNKIRFPNKYVYCGEKVYSRAIKISDNEILFEIEDERTKNKWHISVYPFKRGELLTLLKEAGFTKIEQYSDYKKGFNIGATFYQYVCEK